MSRIPEQPSEPEVPEELTERVTHAAEALADTLDEVADGPTRHELVKTLGQTLEHTGVQVVDLRENHAGGIFGLDPDALNGQKGVATGRTRSEILAARALSELLRRTRRRR